MPGYVVQIRREPLGALAKHETVFVVGDDQAAAITLVKTALRLDGTESVQIVRGLSETETQTLGLKPCQVKHLP